MIVGVDEAGRGCIIGPLVMAACVDPGFDVKDSKLYTKKQRTELFDKLISLPHVVISIPVWVLEQYNMNDLECMTTAAMISQLPFSQAIVDCPSINLQAYKDQLSSMVEGDLLVQHKAEEHNSVAAASVIAKVYRDRILAGLKQRYDIECGSGYLSDYKTQDFLKKHWRTHSFLFRKTWKPYRELCQSTLNQYV